MMHPVIMAGGSGTRFWPRSRRHRPKQLIRIIGEGTMIQQTVARLAGGFPRERFLIVTAAEQADAMRAQLPELSPGQIVAEPCGRDTAACIGLAAFMLRKRDPDAVMAVCSADHVIEPGSELVRELKEAGRLAAERGVLVTFGVKPDHPSVRYGYVRRGDAIPGYDRPDFKAFALREFTEKPDPATAKAFLAGGDYYWNSGNFVWRVNDILEAIRVHMPELHAGLERIEPALGTPKQADVLAEEYPLLPKTSIDYGVMEKASNAAVVEAMFAWDDVGAWDSIARHRPADEKNNVVVGKHLGTDTEGCILVAENGHLLATVGVRDLIVVHTDNATLVCDRGRAADVKGVVERLEACGESAYL